MFRHTTRAISREVLLLLSELFQMLRFPQPKYIHSTDLHTFQNFPLKHTNYLNITLEHQKDGIPPELLGSGW